MTLENFPRGGKKSEAKSSSASYIKKTKKLSHQKDKKKKSEKVEDNAVWDQNEPLDSNTAQDLRYKSLYIGMTILGRIYTISQYDALVALPGQLSGKLKATDISETYTKSLQKIVDNDAPPEFKTLTEMYKQGDYVICYVKSINKTEGVILSLEPHLINQKLNPKLLEKGSKVCFTINSVEDHGYVMETGLSNLRAFLKKTDVENEDLTFCPGKQIICNIKKMELAEKIFTAKISTKAKHMATIEVNIKSVDNLVPGMQISLHITKILHNGLKVRFGSGNLGLINQIYLPKKLAAYEKGENVIGTLLYTLPTVKFSYFSLLSEDQEKLIKIGNIFDNAKVIARESRGILVKLKKGVRGYIPNKRTDMSFEKIPTKFPVDSNHCCRVLTYDLVQHLFICTIEKELLNEKYFDKSELSPGLLTEVTIDKKRDNGTLDVSAGRINGIVPPDQITDPGMKNKFKVGDKVTSRVLSINEENTVFFTLKKTLVETKLPLLCNKEDIKLGSIYDGSVIKISDQGVLVRFFGNITGEIPSGSFGSNTTSKDWNLLIGQTVQVKIQSTTQKHGLILTLSNISKINDIKLNVGDIVEGTVTDSSSKGVFLRIEENNEEICTGFLPAGHMSPCNKVGKLLASKMVSGDRISAIVFATHPRLILSTTFVPENSCKISELHPGEFLMCSISEISKKYLKMILPVKKIIKHGIVNIKDDEFPVKSLYEHQIMFAIIESVNVPLQKVTLTIDFGKIWQLIKEPDVRIMACVDLLSSYLNKMGELSRNIYYKSRPISLISLGQSVEGIISSIVENFIIVTLENNVQGLVHKSHYCGLFNVGDKVTGKVLWIDYAQEYVGITLFKKFIDMINTDQKKVEKLPIDTQIYGTILLVTDWFVLVVLKGNVSGTLAAIPVRRHLNEIEPIISPYTVGSKIKCYSVINADDADTILPICVVKSIHEHNFKIQKHFEEVKIAEKRKIIEAIEKKNIKIESAKKRKLEKKSKKEIKQKEDNIDSIVPKSSKKNSQQSNLENIQTDLKLEQIEIKTVKELLEEEKAHKDFLSYQAPETNIVYKNLDELNTLPDPGFNFNNEIIPIIEKDLSSDDEDSDVAPKEKKRKLTPAEIREAERIKETKIREKEEALASNSHLPETEDQFERLLLASPDNSLIWIQYMAFHMQSSNYEKAKEVANKATKTINFREEDEKLNVWQAWINLESEYGSPDNLNEVFEEAVKLNDAEKIYFHMWKVHADAGRNGELEKLVNTIVRKFKDNPETWIKCGSSLLAVGLKERSRFIMQRAVQSLPDNKHVDLMVQFAQLENKFGDKERSQTLFEQILSTYPKRTDVWSLYVDSLVKSNDVELARKILERAINQSIPAKKMKTLFKKYVNFEQTHGTPENVSRVQELAVKYVEEQCNKFV